ncbi:WXG100 family type VII secretion target [Actinokineospora sp. UTMC 2448]|uniref:WXG100 family type VII secretion target n=1 Tax=Actinokineospora sp. UTMC 2448 TaxID=2268449 RepID=UPI00216469E3|nr:WXG100 family type VII secretion target [Actinokineospora sp. UTMC 2448]UVS77161.1 hypothetical protein Actkin_00863 [Actinokineospora sp. UTMC 2448]
MIGSVEQLVQRFQAAAQRAAAAAEQDRRARRGEDDRWVTGGVHWDGYSLKALQRMVGQRANANQLDMLADRWASHGDRIAESATDLSRSLQRLLQFWSGTAAEGARTVVVRNCAWLAETAATATRMARPIEDAGGALRSAQSTMPGGSPSSPWFATVGGGAAAGLAVGGPIGAAFGAAIGGIASAFGFGSNKKKMKRKAVQTMRRYETALLGIDGATPRFGDPADGVDPGADPTNPRPPSTGVPGPGVPPPSGSLPPELGAGPKVPPPMPTPDIGTSPSLAPSFDTGWERRWQGLTGMGPGPGAGANPGGLPGLGGGPVGFGGLPGASAGRGVGMGRGALAGGAAGMGRGGAPGVGRGGAIGDRQRGAAGRFGRGTGFGSGYGAPAGGARKEEDGEHRRRVPLEDDPFTPHDLRAAPPVIGL